MKRILALILCLALCVSLVPAAFAGEIEIADEPEEEIVVDAEAAGEPEGAALPAEEPEKPAAEPVGDGAPDVPSDEIAVVEPARADEPEVAPIPDESEPNDSHPFSWDIWNGYCLEIRGNVPDYGPGEAPWYQYRDEITSIDFDRYTDYVGDCAFYGMYNVTGVRDATFKDIGDYAFYGCSSLMSYKIVDWNSGPGSVGSYAFANCSSLKYICFCGEPEIGYQAFSNCGSPEIYFYHGAPDFDEYCFGGTTAKAWYPPNGEWSSSDLQDYGGTITWTKGYRGPAGPDVVWDCSESGNLSLTGTGRVWYDSNQSCISIVRDLATTANIGEGITGLEYFFSGMSNLRSVSLPESLTEIRQWAFGSCTSLTSIDIPAKMTELGYGVFENCTSLREVHFRGIYVMFISQVNPSEEDLNSIFKGVTATVYYPPAGVWDEKVGQQYGGILNWVCDDKIGDDVTWSMIGRTVTLSGSGDTWDYNNGWPGFYYLRDYVEDVVIDSRITRLGNYLFYGLKNIQKVVIPASVERIGKYAFARMSSLKEIRYLGNAPGRDTDTFKGVTATAYYYPVYSWNSDTMTGYGGTFTWVCDDKLNDSVTWSLDIYGKLTLTGSGSTGDWTEEYPGFYNFRHEIKEIDVGSGVTSLGQWLFFSMDKLQSVTVGPGVKTVAYGAISYSDSLKTIRFKGHAPTFTNGAFLGVKATAYYPPVPDWTSDVRQNYGGTLTWACDDKVGDNVTWWLSSSGVLTLTGSGATWNWPSEYPDFYAFKSECKEIEVGPGITALGNYLFYYMDSATKATLPKGLESIGKSAFQYCSALKQIVFKGHAPTIGSLAFGSVTATVTYYPLYSWTSSTLVNYGGSLSWTCDNKIGEDATWELYSNGTLWIGGSGATDDFPGPYPAFYSFKEECTSVVIGSSVTRLGTYLLYNMDSTTDVTVNEGLTAISDSAFGNMSALKWIRFKGNAPTFASNCFYSVTATAYYHSSKSGWTSSVMQDYRGDITWVDMDAGYVVTITDYTKGAATCSLVNGGTYSGSQTFTVSAGNAVLVAVKNGSGYTALSCTTSGSTHKFTVNISAATEIVLVYKGDANLDGKVNLRDAQTVKGYVAGEQLSAIAKLAADANSDNRLNLRDAQFIKKVVAGDETISW